MGSTLLSTIILSVFILYEVTGQENSMPRIPSSLLECYQNKSLIQRDLRLPSSMPVLIDLIRRVENHPEMMNRDMREVAIQLIHRFKLDGIQKFPKVTASSDVVPYSPGGDQFYKHNIALRRLLPGNAAQFPNQTLTPLERCSLHHMMSSTIEMEVRNDEGTVCNRLSQYRTQRLPRQVRVDSDVEVLDPNMINQLNEKGHMQVAPDEENADAETLNDAVPDGPRSMERAVSKCPVESGIVYSQWGAVAVGPLLMGIAAGLQPAKVPIKELTSKDTTYSGIVVDNRFALTLAGDLGEVTLFQGPVNSNVKVGGSGGWNGTQAPKWFFLSQSTNNEMTDAEIRGGLDGLILAFNMQSFKQKAPSMRLSQLLEMYYSQRGAFSDKVRACNRRSQYTEYAPSDMMLQQTLAMSLLLDDVTLLQGTIIGDGYRVLSQKSVDSLKDYIPSSLNDLSCTVTSISSANGDIEIKSNLILVVDKGFLFKDIEVTIIDILHKINTSPVGSTVTIISASEGKVICETSDSLATTIECFNQDNYNAVPERVDMYKVLESIKELSRGFMSNETSSQWVGGQSSVVLLVMSQVAIDSGSYSADMLKYITEQVPDLRFLVFTTGNKERFNNLVRDPPKDIYTFTISPNTEPQVKEIVSRVSQVPRRIINHRCGPDYDVGESSNGVYTGYVAPQKISYYRLHPNYFFRNNGETHLRVTGSGFSSLTLCHSRSIELPRSNSSSNDAMTCIPLTGSAQEISLRNTCNDVSAIKDCAPLYFSIEAGRVADVSSAQICSERACPQPDNIKYTINTQNLGCFSGAAQMAFSSILFVLSLLLTFHHV